ncbi:macrolide transport system ATP-binding/permease protein [Ancylobacter sp. 3268]|uniref:MacB family efflux pump subunit n=1 Tax=Ancylobacter sp. 3268 TaxID=2817752 RepID=UPI00285EFB41|nr:MacB family efflux pump subunit [Ancylobacter sp. 3268]MDR6953552.1 macrolide transport system ATP-binding/permease protein [Ancylobacter sp. 3268]
MSEGTTGEGATREGVIGEAGLGGRDLPSPVPPAGTPIVELVDVSRLYPNGETVVRALDRVSLSIMPGEFVAIMGQSGSGKSTLMNIVGCLDRPSSGQYRVAGVDVAGLDPDALAHLRCSSFGFVFQRYNLLPSLTAAENVEIPAIYAGLPRERRVSRSHALLARLGLAERAGHRPSQLSGGQQQRVSIARALMNAAPVILADEPTGALDSRSGEEVLALLTELNAEGHTVILITHDAEVAAHARRIVRFQDGHIVSDEPTPRAALPPPAAPPKPAGHLEGRGGLARFVPDLAEAVRMAFASMYANLFRTVLTLLGIVIGVASVITMLAVGDGGKQQVMERIAQIGTNLLIVRPGAAGIRTSGDNATLLPEDADALRAIPGLGAVAPERTGRYTMRFGSEDYFTQITGTTADYLAARDWPMERGVMFSAADVKAYTPVLVLGQTVARNLFGEDDPIGRYVLVKNVPYQVIGILGARGANAFGQDQDDVALVPLSTGFVRVFGRRFVNSVTLKVDDAANIPAVEREVTRILTERHQAEDFQVRNTAQFLETAMATQETLTLVLGCVAAISLIVAGIGVMNIMLVSVTERTREIGIRMATGARMSNIMLQFNTEALVVCGVGGAVGVVLGLGAAVALAMLGVNIVLSLLPPLLAFGCAFLTGLIFGYLPARKAAGMDPVVALAYE